MTAEPNTPDMLSIQLSRAPDAECYSVDSVDIAQPSCRHRLTFAESSEYRCVLCAKLADYVQGLLDKVDRDTMVYSAPDALVELPGLALGRLRMLVHTTTNRARQVIIRFAYFVGGVQAAFRVETHFKLPSVTHREALAVAALNDICLPVFDIVSGVVSGLIGEETRELARERLRRVAEVESDLLFYLELLKRYVKSTNSFEALADVGTLYRLERTA